MIPGLGRCPGEGKGYPLQYSGLENSTDCIVHGVTKSRTRLSTFTSLQYQRHSALLCSCLWPRISVLTELLFSEAVDGWVCQGLPLSPTLPRAPVAPAGSLVAMCRETNVRPSPAAQAPSHGSHVECLGGLFHLARWGLLQFSGTSGKGWGWGGERGQGRTGGRKSTHQGGMGPRRAVKHRCR